MVHCRNCGQLIEATATACPHCGAAQGLGSSRDGPLPDGIRGWSWGAFFLNWIWGPFNGTWIALLALVPYLGFVMAIVLGFKGREWAWRNKRWDSVEHFNRVQRKWSIWGTVIVVGSFVLGIAAAYLLPSYDGWFRTPSGAVRVAIDPPTAAT